jgi:hypothetical protein
MGRGETGGSVAWWTILDALVLIAAVSAGAILGEYLVRELRTRRMHVQVEEELRAAATVPVTEIRVQRPASAANDQADADGE